MATVGAADRKWSQKRYRVRTQIIDIGGVTITVNVFYDSLGRIVEEEQIIDDD